MDKTNDYLFLFEDFNCQKNPVPVFQGEKQSEIAYATGVPNKTNEIDPDFANNSFSDSTSEPNTSHNENLNEFVPVGGERKKTSNSYVTRAISGSKRVPPIDDFLHEFYITGYKFKPLSPSCSPVSGFQKD